MIFEGSTEDAHPKAPLQQIDITPIAEHLRYQDDGYEAVFLTPGQHFDLEAELCTPLESPESMEGHGFATKALPIAWLSLGNTFPVLLFDRGPRAEGVEKLIKLPTNEPNIEVDKRFFLLGEEGYIQVGIRSGAGHGTDERLKAFQSFGPGERVFLGRNYGNEFNSEFTPRVSQKHLVIEVGRRGLLRFTDSHSTNGTVIKFSPVS